jgi:hypothetical protein
MESAAQVLEGGLTEFGDEFDDAIALHAPARPEKALG